MKLSEQLKQDHECGDFGKALEGYSDRAELLEEIIEELTQALRSSYISSPEGREYLEKARNALTD